MSRKDLANALETVEQYQTHNTALQAKLQRYNNSKRTTTTSPELDVKQTNHDFAVGQQDEIGVPQAGSGGALKHTNVDTQARITALEQAVDALKEEKKSLRESEKTSVHENEK